MTRARHAIAAVFVFMASFFARPGPLEEKALRPQDTVARGDIGRRRFRGFSRGRAFKDNVRKNNWVFTAIYKNAKALGSVPWQVMRRTAMGALEPVENHALVDLVRRPNVMWSFQQTMKRITISLQACGNAFLGIYRFADGSISELWDLAPSRIDPIPAGPESDHPFRAYRYTRENGTWVEFPPQDVVHFMIPDPEDHYWGLSPLEPLSKSVETDTSASEAQKSTMDRGFTPSAIISPKEGKQGLQNNPKRTTNRETGMSTQKAKAARKRFETDYIGPKNWGRPVWVGRSINVDVLQRSEKEIGLIKSKKLLREEVVSGLDLPPPLAGILEHANYSNAREMRTSWWEDGLLPMLDDLAQTLNIQLVDANWQGEDLELHPDTTNVPALRAAFTEQIDQAVKLKADLGWSDDEVEARVNLGRPQTNVTNARARGAKLRLVR